MDKVIFVGRAYSFSQQFHMGKEEEHCSSLSVVSAEKGETVRGYRQVIVYLPLHQSVQH